MLSVALPICSCFQFLSKQIWHERKIVPSFPLCLDMDTRSVSCKLCVWRWMQQKLLCAVVGVCIASENSDQCLIKVGLAYTWHGCYLQVCAACPTVLSASVCCLPNCIICKCVLPAQLYYLQVCAACPTVWFASVCCLPNCIICKCVLPAQLYYLQVCAACPTPCLIPKDSSPVHPGNNIHDMFPTGTWLDTTLELFCLKDPRIITVNQEDTHTAL
jgi:hypothetical protein